MEVKEIIDFGNEYEPSDLGLIVEDTKFKVHRQLLSLSSDVFQAMLHNGMKESSMSDITITMIPKEHFESFLNYLYFKKINSVTAHNAIFLMDLAAQYSVDTLFKQCEEILLKQSMTLEIAFLADQHQEKAHQLFQYAMKWAAKEFNVLSKQGQEKFIAFSKNAIWLMLIEISSELLEKQHKLSKLDQIVARHADWQPCSRCEECGGRYVSEVGQKCICSKRILTILQHITRGID